MHARAHGHARTLPNPGALGPEIEEGAVKRPTDPPLAFPRPGIGFMRIWQLNSPYHTKVNKSIPSSSVDTQITLAGKVALATFSEIKPSRFCRMVSPPGMFYTLTQTGCDRPCWSLLLTAIGS